jgi:predicted nuclease of predicted toxin-antitoxin system
MKVLLDENLPHALRHMLAPHDVYTVAYMGWTGIENGNLLSTAAEERFDVLLSVDKGLGYELNQFALPISIVLLSADANDEPTLRPLIPDILAVLENLTPRTLVKIP